MDNFYFFINGLLNVISILCLVVSLFSFYLIIYRKRDLDFYMKKVDGKETASKGNALIHNDATILFIRYFFSETPKVSNLKEQYKTKRILDVINEVNSFHTYLKFSIPTLIVCIVFKIFLESNSL